MTKYVTATDQCWGETEVRGVKMETCRLWEGKHNVRSGFARMPKGLQIPTHHHAYWVQVFVMSGKMQVEAVGSEAHIIAAGEYYFVEPGAYSGRNLPPILAETCHRFQSKLATDSG